MGSETVPGKPIVNSIKESLVMLDTLPDLDYVLIEDTAGDKHGTGLIPHRFGLLVQSVWSCLDMELGYIGALVPDWCSKHLTSNILASTSTNGFVRK